MRSCGAVQDSGEAWMSGTTWDGRAAIRISVSNWRTSDDDVARTVRGLRSRARAHLAAGRPAGGPVPSGL